MNTRSVALLPRMEREAPLTRLQREVWASQRLAPTRPVANMASAHRIGGAVDPDRLAAAFDAVVRASAALRTVIAERGGRPVARVLATPPATTEFIDLPADEVAAWCASRVATPVDASSCSYDSVLLRHGEDDWTWWLDLHHVVTDGWSQGFVHRLTSEAYTALCDDVTPTFDLVDMYEHAAARGATTDQLSAGSSGSAPPLQPFGVRRPSTTASRRIAVDADVVSASERYPTLSVELSTVATLACALAVVMHRLDGRDDYAIGVPVHHRSGRAAQRVVGPLMELHPIVVSVRPGDTFEELMRRTTASLIEMLRDSRSGRAQRHDFEMVVNVFGADYGDFAGMATVASWVRAPHVDPAHTVRLHAFDYGQGVQLELDVNEALVPVSLPCRLDVHVAAVIAAMGADPAAEIGSVRLVTDADIADAAALVPAAPQPPEVAVHDAIAAAFDADPTWVVARERVDGVDVEVTAADFDERVRRAAAWMRSNGVERGRRVGLRMHRSVDVLVAIHAVLRAGASFVMLDPDDPSARHEAIRLDAQLALIVDDLDASIDVSDEASNDVSNDGIERVVVDLDDIAYVLYTSGSTGEPKGVPISHRGLADYLDFASRSYCTPDQAPVVALHSKLVFDLTITSLFVSFLTGGTVVVFDGEPVAALGEIARDDSITFLKATPTQLEVFTRIAHGTRAIDTVVVGGESFRRPVAESMAAVCAPGVRIFNEYGPTEAVVGCMIHEWDRLVDHSIDVPIGHAAPGCEIAVLDRFEQPVASGAWGELYVRRVGMATAYLRRDELSAERFVDLVDMPGQLGGSERGPWYRTGDRVRLERPGVTTYGGRFDDQMKVNGVRLEPAEVEAAMVEHPDVVSALVRLWTPSERASTHRCSRCGLGLDVPGITLDEHDVCSVCRSYDEVAPQTAAWFRNDEDLDAELARARERSTGDYDCLHLLSGGKDSSYALYQLVERGWRVHALTLDNGFISEGAKENIQSSIDALGITHEFASTEAMNEIFRDSLDRYSNVCQGCYKTIYTMAVARADALGIPVIVTGLSRGQFFETRLIPAQFESGRFDPDAIDATVLEARKVYHQVPDAVTRRLPEQAVFDDPGVFDRVEFVDFYRYVDVDLAELYRYLEENAPWVRPSDTGRSTNCLVNVAGIQVHKAERGYHNYAEPYSWDVRLGHKTREEALEELDDEVDDAEVQRLLAEVEYEPKQVSVLTAWFQSVDGCSVDPSELRAFVRERVADHAVPAAFVRIEEMPLASSAKADASLLPAPLRVHRHGDAIVEPDTPTERSICEIWAEVLRLERVGVVDDFFDLGGDSLAALEVIATIDDVLGASLDDATVFQARTVRELAVLVDAATFAGALNTVAIPRLDTAVPSPLSAGEEAMLFEYRRDPSDTRYNVTRWYRLPAQTDLERLQAAIEAVAAAHAPLHTSYASDRRRLADPVAFEMIDACSVSEFRTRAELARAVPFDLDDGPLVRVLAASTRGNEDDNEGDVDSGADEVSVLIGMHHISIDAGAFDVFWNQVSASYTGGDTAVPDVSYADHGAWQRERSPHHLEQWNRVRSVARPEPARLAIAAPSPAEADGYLSRDLDLSTSQLRRGVSTTPFAAALAAAGAALARFSASDHVEIGITASVKDHPGAAPLVGYFLNTLPIEVSVPVDAALGQLDAQVGELVAASLEHRIAPFASIVRDARAAGHRPPDASYMLAYERLAPALLGGHEVSHEILASGTAVADVTLFVQERGEQLSVGIEHAGAVVSARDAARILDAFAELLVATSLQPELAVRELAAPHLSGDMVGAELQAGGVASDVVLASIVEHGAATPEATAVVDAAGASLSYAQLVEASSRLAARLPDGSRFVGVCVGRSLDMVVALLAAQLAGAAYVPLDPQSPPERLQAIAESVDLSCVLVDQANADRFGDEMRAVVVEASTDGAFDIDAVRRQVAAIDAADDAYVIFTSGSTGTPRGVAVTHGQLAASTSARLLVYDASPERFLLTSSIGFDSSIVGLFWTLSTGGAIVVPGDDDVHDVDRLVAIVERHAVTLLLMVPSLYRALLARGGSRLTSLRTAIVAGEACPDGLVAEHMAAVASDLYNEYGPTEATVWSTVHRASPGDTTLPIGGPIPGVTVRIADQKGSSVPVGVAGELLVSGPTVTNGYLDDAEATAQRFVEIDDERWYRTGDLVRAGAGGPIRFLGRVDDQLNVGGVRLEPGEIEAVLLAMPDVDDAVVVATNEGRPRLVAHVAGADVGELDEATIRRFLADRLPATHLPSRIGVHESLPRTSHGKLDRVAAAALSIAGVSGAAGQGDAIDSTTADVDAAEIVQIWRMALGRDDVGSDTDYFDAGGDSLAAVEIVAALESRLDRAVAIGVLLDGRTPAGMASLLGVSAQHGDGTGDSKGASVATSRMVTMQAGSGEAPIVLLTPAWDDVFGYGDLTNALPDDVSVYALSAAETASADIVTTIPELVESFEAHLVDVLDERPITIVGWSTGGVAAYELAQRLRSDGHRVERVAMVDTFFPGAEQHLWSNRWWKYKSLSVGAVAGEARTTAKRRAKAVAKTVGSKLLAYAGTPVPPTPKRTSTGGVPIEAFGYRPEQSDIVVVHYAADTTNPDRTHHGWSTVAEVDVVPVEGRHRGYRSIMDAERVGQIADDLTRRLDADRS